MYTLITILNDKIIKPASTIKKIIFTGNCPSPYSSDLAARNPCWGSYPRRICLLLPSLKGWGKTCSKNNAK